MIKTTPVRLRVVALVWGLLLAANTLADFSESHFVRVSMDGAVATEFTPKEWNTKKHPNKLQRSIGGNGAIGIGYRYANKGLLVDVGIGCGYTYYNNELTDSLASASNSKTDANGKPLRPDVWNYYTYPKNENIIMGVDTGFTLRHDYIRRLSLQVPLMIGGEWRSWYAMGGIKVNVNVYSMQREEGEATPYMTGYMWWKTDPVTGKANTDFSPENSIAAGNEYAQLGQKTDYGVRNGYSGRDEWRNRSNWTSDNIPVTFDLRLCAEIGYRLNYRNTSRGYHGNDTRFDYYISAFAEYGVYRTTPYIPFEFGVRMTAIFEVKKKPAFRWEETQRGDAGKKRIPNRYML